MTAHGLVIHTDVAHVLLYDGEPANGAPAIADYFIHPGENSTANIWLRWTPMDLDIQHLRAAADHLFPSQEESRPEFTRA